jgi:NADH:ubiquinone oxidoreductase subunit 6 (subunit J)
MTPLFLLAAAMTLGGAVAALSLRNLIHCALALVGAFLGLALVYLELGAQFVGLAQILVYVGAVAILIVFAILLTRGGELPEERQISGSLGSGVGVALLVLGCLVATVLASQGLPPGGTSPSEVAAAGAVRNIGEQLMTEYVLPLEVVGLLLTAALIGAALIAMHPGRPDPRREAGGSPGPKPSASASRVHALSGGGRA